MRKLEIIEHISLDGEIQASDDDGDFPYGDWTAPYRTPADREEIIAAHGESFDLLLGRRTYDIWSGFWPKAPHTFCKATGFKLNRLDLADGDLLFGPVVKFGGPQKLLCSHVLGMLKPASVLQVNRHTGCARGVTPDRRPEMTSLRAKVITIEKRDDLYHVIVQISTKYRGSFNTLAFGEIKPYSGSLKAGRLDLVYYRDPGLEVGDRVWTLR